MGVNQLEANLQAVRERMRAAAVRCRRDPDACTLVAVTKYVEIPQIRALYDLGVRDFGESRPQSLWAKAPLLPNDICWHFVGTLQTNKVRRTLPLVSLVHSLDRWELTEKIEEEATRLDRVVPVLLEVLISGESAKHGFLPEEVVEVASRIATLPHLKLSGLMGMARDTDDESEVRRSFAILREQRDACRTATGLPMEVLSMGMSGDFEWAIAEGATHVRIGSALFEGIAP